MAGDKDSKYDYRDGRSDEDMFRDLDAKLEGMAAVVEELLVNQQELARRLNPSEPNVPTLKTTNAGLYVTSRGTAGGLTQALQSRGTFTLFAKCCHATCHIVIQVPTPGG